MGLNDEILQKERMKEQIQFLEADNVEIKLNVSKAQKAHPLLWIALAWLLILSYYVF